MARGWESKAVEDQINEVGTRRVAERDIPYNSSPVVRERMERLKALELSRARTLEQLHRAAHSRHREMLERTLAALERDINELS